MSNPVMFKSQLQEYTQKHSLSAPIYEHVKEGPSHEPNFTATVIVNGIRYDSPTAFRNRKTAEHAAAQVALQELGKAANGAGGIPNPVFESGLCKNLLQEYAQKLNLPVPSYCCEKSGEGHTGIFISTVEIAGISYVGGPAKNKKTAEIKAARTALSAIQTQYCSQGTFTNATSSHHGAGTNSTHLDVHSGIKRERASDQPSGERTAVKAKKRKQSKKRMGKRREKAAVNGQQTTSADNTSAIAIQGEQSHPQQMSIDDGQQLKQVTSTENTSAKDIKNEQSHPQQMSIDDGQQIKQVTSAENTLAIDMKDQQSHPQQMSVDDGQQIKQVPSAENTFVIDIKDQQSHLQQVTIDDGQQIKQVEGLDSQGTGQKSEDQEMVESAGEEVKQIGVVMVDALGESEQGNQGDIITNGLGKNEQDKQEVDHEIYKLPSNKEEKKNGTPDFSGSDEQNKQLSNQGIEKLPVDKEVQKLKEEHEEHGTQEEISPLE
uniref:BcpLH protein n=1 Tax=Pinus taeda TaxID=3352 RepID=A0AAT9XYA8_PINTA